MANRKLTRTFLSITADGNTTSEAASFPAANVVNRTTPQKHWRTTVTTDSRLVIDLGSAQTDITVYMDWLNFTSFKYQESANGSSGWTDIGSTLTVEQDPAHGVYRRIDNITMTSKQYLGIWIPTQTPVDSASYFRVGTLAVSSNMTELDAETGVEFPLGYELSDSNIVENQFPGGKTEKINISQLQPMIISFAISTPSEQQNIKGAKLAEVTNLLRDPTQIILLDFNLGESWQAYLVKKVGGLSSSIDTTNIGTISFGTTIFEVVI